MTACDSKTIQIKSGSSAIFGMIYTDANDNPISLAGYSIYMDFREAKTGELLVSTSIGNGITIMEVEGDDTTTGHYSVDAGNTAEWQLGEMPVDILYENVEEYQHTEDLILDIGQGRTQVPTITPA